MQVRPENPVIVQGDGKVLVETKHPRYEAARDLLARFAELEASPEHLHTYRITPLSLWNAASSGMTREDIVDELRDYTICNQFRNQEPGNNSEIESFCQINYGVSFPMHTKIDVNGSNAHPLYRQLKRAKPGLFGSKGIKWNFTKFLVRRDGEILARYAFQVTPESLTGDIEGLLG